MNELFFSVVEPLLSRSGNGSEELKAVCFRIGYYNAKTFKELDAVGVISENLLPLYALTMI